MKRILLLLLACISAGAALAQVSVSGTVTDKNGSPLSGVTVYLDGATTGTQTNAEGKFALSVATGDILNFSYMGYITQRVTVTNQTRFDIKLAEDQFSLGEIVAIGYGSVKRVDLATSIATVKPEELQNTKTGSVADALQGLATGVMVNKNSFKPGGSSSILVRGKGSFGNGGASDAPRIYVDGVESNSGLDFISEADIESIQILKDAASTAIFGSKAGNGVILVTTKSGKAGAAKISFEAKMGWQNLANKQDVLNAAQFKELIDIGSGGTMVWDAEEQKMFSEGRSTNWQDEITQTGVYQNYTLGISAGNEKSKYYVGADWVDQTGVIKNTDFNRFNVRFNMNSDLKKWLRMDFKVNVSHLDVNSSNMDGVAGMNSLDQGTMGSAIASKPTAPVYNSDGTFYDNLLLRPNPVAAALYFSNNFKQTRVIGSLGLEIDILKNLKFKSVNGGELIYNISNVFQDDRMGGIFKNTTIADRQNGEAIYLQTDNTLTYDLEYNQHRLTALGGFSATHQTYDLVTAQVLGASNITRGYGLGSGSPKAVGSNYPVEQMASFFVRAHYSYAEKYLLTATFRADGSSKFAKGNKWGYFPSAGVAWRINQENFLKDSKVVSNLKLRASWGAVGNPNISPYQSWALVSTPNNQYYNYIFNDQTAIGSTYAQIAQSSLTWEKSNQVDLGVDFGFFNSRLNGTVDVYNRNTHDLLYLVNLPIETGFDNLALVNVGEMNNKGIEVNLNSVNIQNRNFTWNSNLNFSFNKNKITKLYKDLQREGSRFVGQNIDVIYTKRFGGIWQTNEAAAASVYGKEPGDIKIVDMNRNNINDDDDRTFVGQSTPQYFGGFSNVLTYKNFDFTLFLTYAGGHLIYNPFAYLNTYQPSGNMSPEYYKGYWRPDRASNTYPKLGSSAEPLYQTDAVYQKGDYLRIKNVELGYTLPTHLLNRIGINKVRVYFSAQNLYTWTEYTGFDVETTNANPYPACRSFIGGISLNF